ncbi:phage conserved hypothetical protein, phiE125 gp8 family [Sphingomonas sp. YR710]|uniref:head-tail connector protein n=1 Tax=Sphingomonas sp. YR710 TaxID=1882773 RepID=UPI00088089DB|nr:head-tail connector protein [Sphingomonas sp. YR710]SDC30831.1 phage conserved hypothetical protein, phiE125 gp8 family [Sphingomonas sp. YR710]
MPLLSLAEAKDHLRLEDDDLDSDLTIGGLISTAQRMLDESFGVVIDLVQRRWTLDSFADFLLIPFRPIDADTIEITWLDDAGTAQPFTAFRAVAIGGWLRLLPAIGTSWPIPADAPGVVTVTATAGYAEDAVPDDLKTVGKMLVAHWFENREAAGGSMVEVPLAVGMLLDPYILRRV